VFFLSGTSSSLCHDQQQPNTSTTSAPTPVKNTTPTPPLGRTITHVANKNARPPIPKVPHPALPLLHFDRGQQQ